MSIDKEMQEIRECYQKENEERQKRWAEEDRQKWEKQYREIIDRANKVKEEEPNPIVGSALRKYEQEARVRGEVINPFIKQNLEGKISVARWVLALAMGMTLLFKGFWVLWILFIILYNWEVKRLKKDALEKDMKRGKKK